jgi:hypothetical protein
VTWRKTSSSCLRASSFFARTAAYSASPKFQICSDRRFQALLPASGRERGKSPCHSRARKGKGKCGRPGTSEKILRIPRKRARIPDITASTPTSSHNWLQGFRFWFCHKNPSGDGRWHAHGRIYASRVVAGSLSHLGVDFLVLACDARSQQCCATERRNLGSRRSIHGLLRCVRAAGAGFLGGL